MRALPVLATLPERQRPNCGFMNLVILHHHLNPGGVTRVIANHLLALDAVLTSDESLRVLILCDGQTAGWPRDLSSQLNRIACDVVGLPNLGYDAHAVAHPDRLATQVRGALTANRCDPENTVLHAHNHSLGKNASFPGALRQLAENGYPLLLQIHDFAEDFRPQNYRLLRAALGTDSLSRQLYFHAAHVHFATLNRRDLGVLDRAGIPEELLHLLPNPVMGIDDLPSKAEAKAQLKDRLRVNEQTRYVLYPVRGIRRKNLGEMLLLSAIGNSDDLQPTILGLTLAPQNPSALPYYERWKSLAEQLQLPCLFDTGGENGLSFAENLAASDCVLTTSVAEGFGMVFLEAWLAGKPLVGRNLPEITIDFVEAGVQLDALYQRLAVPLKWIGRQRVVDAMETACRALYAAYDVSAPSRMKLEAIVDRMTDDGTIDFGRLEETLQEMIIRRIVSSNDDKSELVRLNPVLETGSEAGDEMISRNRNVVENRFSLRASGQQLRAIYDKLLQSPRSPISDAADANLVLSEFLDLERFHLIRT